MWRRSKADVDLGRAENDSSQTRRRGFGPFSGAQLTIIVITLCVVVGFPIGAWGVVSFTNVSITDPGGVNRAKVNASGQLSTSGTVTAHAAPASSLIAAHQSFASGSCTTIASPPAGKAFVITSVHVNVLSNPTPGLGTWVNIYRGSGCSDTVDSINPSGIGGFPLDYGEGFTVTATGAVTAYSSNITATVWVFGYTVSASSVPA